MTEATTVAELQARIDSALAELDRTAYDMGYLSNRAGDAAANLDRVRRARAALTGDGSVAVSASSPVPVEGDVQEIDPKIDTSPGSVKELEPVEGDEIAELAELIANYNGQKIQAHTLPRSAELASEILAAGFRRSASRPVGVTVDREAVQAGQLHGTRRVAGW